MDLRCEKQKRKAIRIAVAATPGLLEMWAVEGSKSNQLVLVGDDLDPVCLVSALRKKVGPANIVKVEDVGAKKKKKNNHGYAICPRMSYPQPQPQPQVVILPASTEPSSCIVM